MIDATTTALAHKMRGLKRGSPERREAARLYNQAYYRLNGPRDRKAYSHAWYLRNRDQVLAYGKRYESEHREQTNANHRAWDKRNPEKVRARDRRWTQTHPEQKRQQLRNSRERNREAFKRAQQLYRQAHRAEHTARENARRANIERRCYNTQKNLSNTIYGRCLRNVVLAFGVAYSQRARTEK